MAKIPGYRLHKPSGRAVVTLAGKDYYLGRHGTPESKREYKRLVAEYVASDPGTFRQTKDTLTIVEVMAGYLKHCDQYYGKRAKPELQRIKLALRPVKQIYGTTLAAEFGPLQHKAVRESLINQAGRDGKQRSRRYVNQIMKRIVAMFRWAASEGLVSANVFESLRLIPGLKRGRTNAVESKPIRPISDSIVDATLSYLPSVVADMVRLQRLLGCRPAEVCSLQPSMVDRSSDVWEIKPEDHKCAWRNKGRVIYAGPKAQAVLAPYLLRAADQYCFSPIEAERQRREKRHSKRVTPLSYGNRPGTNVKRKPKRQPGNQYDTASYRRAIERSCVKAGVEPWSPNRLRHSRGTEIRKKYGLEAAQTVLGHSQANVTEIYAERDAEKAREVMREVG